MHSDTKRLYIVTAMYFAVLLLVCFVSDRTAQLLSLAAISLVFATGVCVFIKKRHIHSLHKRQAALLLAAFAVCSVAVYFITGAKFGYYRVGVSLTAIWRYAIPTVVSVVATEVIRSVLLAQNKRLVGVVAFFTCVVVDVLILEQHQAFSSFEHFMDTLALIVLPCVSSNFLYHHVSKSFGVLAVVPYKLILFVYPYIFAFRPLLPDSLLAFAKIMIPIGLYCIISRVYKTGKRVTAKAKRRLDLGITATAGALALAFILLISGQLTCKMIVIATESMTGTINKGDAIIYEAYGEQTLKTDDIIVFDKGGSLIVHRIVDVTNINGEVRYYTKGDANDSADSGYLTDGQIVGVVKLKIIYMGYPSIWVRSLFT